MASALNQVFDFLKDLKENNHKEWFQTHKGDYETAHQSVIDFADHLLEAMNKHDVIETNSGKKSLFRIYRDVRFAKDKTPYKTSWSGGFKRATAECRGGYYFHLEPGGQSFLAGGFWGPNAQDLKQIRDHIAADDQPLRDVIHDAQFKKYFGELLGDQVKTAPKGFPKDHSAIDLLRYKQFLLRHSFTDQEVLSKDFANKVSEGFRNMRPFLDYMSEILTTDLNGLPLT